MLKMIGSRLEDELGALGVSARHCSASWSVSLQFSELEMYSRELSYEAKLVSPNFSKCRARFSGSGEAQEPAVYNLYGRPPTPTPP